MIGKKLATKVLSAAAVSSIIFSSFATTAQLTTVSAAEKKDEVKNIIFLIGDGMGPAYTSAYRYLKDDPSTPMMEPIAFDEYLVGMQKTNPEDPEENITDSAAAATSMATGVKTYNGAISVDNDKSPVDTVLEQAKANGKATGLVATSQINHATPAAFGSHDESRHHYNSIADDYYDLMMNGEHLVDVLLGGGTNYFEREDRDLTDEFQEDGYSYVTTKQELMNDDNDQVLGLFAPVGLPKMKDRTDEVPSLEDMTNSALDRLSTDEDGFFLMVEGSQIDLAGHRNDIVGVMSEMEDFEKAFQAAIDFAKQDGETLVVTTADHSTGGLSIGRGGPYVFNPQPIKDAKRTPEFMAAEIAEGGDVEEVLNKYTDFEYTEEEIQTVEEAVEMLDENKYALSNAIAEIFNVRSHTGWTTSGHTGVDVQVYAYGPGKEMFMGTTDNTDQAKSIFKLLGNGDLNKAMFKDFQEGDFGYPQVSDLVKKDIINGYTDGMFKPNKATTVRQADVLLSNSTGKEIMVEENGAVSYGTLAKLFVGAFDLGEAGTFEENVDMLQDAGIFGDVAYNENQSVSRVKFAIYLHRAIY